MTKLIIPAILALACLPYGVVTNAQETDGTSSDAGQLEEIVVTGSLIKRASYDDVGSPIDVLDRSSLDADAPTGKLTDIVRYLPQNVGEWGADDGDFAAVTRYGGGTIDLRGLGAGSTLVLVNGRRQTRFALSTDGRVDVNAILPNIMVERLEVLNDGASAIYGTDAVGGVVNMITRDDFEGVELRLDARAAVGAPNDAFSDHYSYTGGALFGGQVGDNIHIVAGFEYFEQDDLDPRDIGLPFERGPVAIGAPFEGFHGSGFGNPGTLLVPQRDANGALTGDITFVGDPDCQNIIDNNITTESGFRTATFIRPGNAFCRLGFSSAAFLIDEERWNGAARLKWDISDSVTFTGGFSFAETDALGFSEGSLPLVFNAPVVPGENPGNIDPAFRAVDANGAPLFAQDGNGDGLPDRDANNVVLLAPVPTVQSAGTIPFQEDMTIFFRPLSTSNGFGRGENLNENGAFRIDAELEGAFTDNWSWQVAWTYSEQQTIQRAAESSVTAITEALNGRGGSTGDQWLNPFGNAILGTGPANSQDVFDLISTTTVNIDDTSLWSVDALVTGDLFELPAGPVGFAAGYHFREETLSQNFDNLITAKEVGFIGNGERDYEADADFWGLYFELAVPVFDSGSGRLDLSLAGRYEEDDINDSFNPKVSLLYSTDSVFDLRASFAESFIAPTLFQRFGTRNGVVNINDPIQGTQGQQIFAGIAGNPNLEAQESDSFNFGVTIRPVGDFSIDLDYWQFDFTGVLAVPSAQAILDADPLGPNVVRDSLGRVVSIGRPFFNAGSIETDGLDIGVEYLLPWNTIGQVVLTADLTTILTYDIVETVGSPTIDGIGSDNNTNIAPPLAEWRGNARLAWSSGNHDAYLTLRYYSDIERVAGLGVDKADATTTFDVQYSYDLSDRGVDGLVVRVGALNLLNEEPNPLFNNGTTAFIRSVQDPRGRMLYASATWSFD